MMKLKLAGCGRAIPSNRLEFDGQVRYRLNEGQSFLDLAEDAACQALENAGLAVKDLDCIVCASATPLQAIPCNAALLHERIAMGTEIPTMDINTSCTSFLSALDVISCMIAAGRYGRVLIVSGDAASVGLNPAERESFELFSDAAAAFVVTDSGEESGILYCAQKTWSEGAHDTEIPGGGTLLSALRLNEQNRSRYYFTMKGLKVIRLTAKKLPGFLDNCFRAAGIRREDVDMVIPHQASKALSMLMPRLGFPEGSYENHVAEYGNMVSASIPYTLCGAVTEGRVRRGDLILLLGTAAGLTVNFMLLRY